MVYALGLDGFISLTGVPTRYGEDGKRLCDAYVVAVAGEHNSVVINGSSLTGCHKSGGSGSGKVALLAPQFGFSSILNHFLSDSCCKANSSVTGIDTHSNYTVPGKFGIH